LVTLKNLVHLTKFLLQSNLLIKAEVSLNT
jgi:hypothetical protein